MRTLFLTSCLLLSVPAFGQETVDGNAWRRLRDVDRIVYVRGVIDGATQVSWGMIVVNQLVDAQTGAAMITLLERPFNGVSAQQIQDALDAFFSDPSNRRIALWNAVIVVLRRINGDDEADIQAMIQRLRKQP